MSFGPRGAVKDFLSELGALCSGENIRAWAVGGCVRDWRLGRDTKDLDIAVEGDAAIPAKHLAEMPGAQMVSHGRFGTASVRCGALRVDFARARTETYAKPAALPKVSFSTIKDDLRRRDFAANAMAFCITPDAFGELLDPFGGLADTEAGVLRVLHDGSFTDDPTRMFRACRFAGRFGWKLEDNTERLLCAAVDERKPELLSRERLRNELLCQLGETNPEPGFLLLEKYGIAKFLHPALRWHSAAAKLDAAAERLGALACAMGAEGPVFLKSLHMERALCARLLSVCALYAAKKSPREQLPDEHKNILRALAADLPPQALEPLMISARDAAELGLRGKDVSALLDEAAGAQWRGEFKDRADCMGWLKSRRAK
jgi:tRNA nucleotidyltransferase/poly(A) polymerase